LEPHFVAELEEKFRKLKELLVGHWIGSLNGPLVGEGA
jgi:hypothetical protein